MTKEKEKVQEDQVQEEPTIFTTRDIGLSAYFRLQGVQMEGYNLEEVGKKRKMLVLHFREYEKCVTLKSQYINSEIVRYNTEKKILMDLSYTN